MLKSKFDDFLSFLKDKKILITTHDLVDIDGLVSCTVLKHFLNQLVRDQIIEIQFSEVSKPSKTFMANFTKKFDDFKFLFKFSHNLSDFDVVLILDTHNLNLVKSYEKKALTEELAPFIFIDHHFLMNKEYKGNLSQFNIISDNYSSTAEIILNLCEEYNVDLNPPLKYLLISGILTDSGFFKYGNNNTIFNTSKLLDDNITIQEVMLLLNRDEEISERIAKIKGMQRVKLIREKDWLIGLSYVSSYEASVASSLVKAGFDVSIVYSEKPKGYRISTRAKKNTCLKSQLHLGRILDEISHEHEGSGGGHDGAASFNGKIDFKIVLNKIIDRVKEILNKQEL